jgi:hypothetical protein
MTFPKGYVKPNKEEAEARAKQEAEARAKQEAEARANLQKSQNDSLVTNDLNSNRLNGKQGNIEKTLENNFNYFLIWKQLREAYLHIMKEATSSYFRLLDFWSQHKNHKE